MRISTIAICLLFLSFKTWGQTEDIDTLGAPLSFKTLEEIIEESKIIHNETMELRFLLNALPDHGWFLQFHNDSTFEYIHWSGWGDSVGKVLEKGTYSIQNNRVLLHSNKVDSDLMKSTYYLLTSPSNSIDNNITIDCVSAGDHIYCLCRD